MRSSEPKLSSDLAADTRNMDSWPCPLAPVLNSGTIVLNMRTVPVQPVELLFGAYRRQVLSLLLLRPDESFYVREIGRLTGVPAGPLHRELKALAEAGLLVRKASGNQVRYQAARDCPIYPELAGIFRKDGGALRTCCARR
jgi:hypothetical protein